MGLVYSAYLPAVSDPDVVKRTVKLVVDNLETNLSVSPTVDKYTLPPIKEGSVVEISVQDEDDAGNKSGWSDTLSFTAIDTIVPSTPGKVSVKLVAEVADPVVAPPEPPPVVVPPPAPEPPVVHDEPVNVVTPEEEPHTTE